MGLANCKLVNGGIETDECGLSVLAVVVGKYPLTFWKPRLCEMCIFCPFGYEP